MSLFTDMRFARYTILLATLAVSGCYQTHKCGAPETCNYLDDDCDGLIDEDFTDSMGRYNSSQNCGGCGIDCTAALPTAGTAGCAIINADAGVEVFDAGADSGVLGIAMCVVETCPMGMHKVNDTACAADIPSLCLPCTTDVDCSLRTPGAMCVHTTDGASLCGSPCMAQTDCSTGFLCQPMASPDATATVGQCAPTTSACACNTTVAGAEYACTVRSPHGQECAGVQQCTSLGLTSCASAFVEACNAQDDNCNGQVDEGFVDSAGRYVSAEACGACAKPCVAPGPNMTATCVANDAAPLRATCNTACKMGFVDVDHIQANGCECEVWNGSGPPPAAGGDANCDGITDDTTTFVFVASSGNDANDGSLLHPKATIAGALSAAAGGKSVLVGFGDYDGFDVRAGVSVFGGYSPDFTARDLSLYPVTIAAPAGSEPGTPALTCHAVTTATRIEGVTVKGSAASVAGHGSTAIYFDGCDAQVTLSSVTVIAGAGANGTRGTSSSDNLAGTGLMSLADLDGVPGSDGQPGNSMDQFCRRVSAGAGGVKMCPSESVSGGAGGAADCPTLNCENGLPCANAGCTDFSSSGTCDIATVLAQAVSNPPAANGAGPSAGIAGDVTYNSPTNRGTCSWCDNNPTLNRDGTRGGNGTPGGDGMAGLGCASVFHFDPASGRVNGGDGTDGTEGTDGSGGGGGSAGSGYAVIGGTDPGCNDVSGGSGGGGGSGGCGAPHATAGTGAGDSIGISVHLPRGMVAGPTFIDVRVVTATGGVGGDGGIGANGGAGAPGGGGGQGQFWCANIGGAGGDGGRGGAAGGGGGGCGGGSHGVFVYTDGNASDVFGYANSVRSTATIDTTGIAGSGGRGGFSPRNPGGSGADGDGSSVVVRAGGA